MKFTSIRGITMPSVVIIPTIVVTVKYQAYHGDTGSLVIALRWLKFALVARWG
jgi:hypothetical protein